MDFDSSASDVTKYCFASATAASGSCVELGTFCNREKAVWPVISSSPNSSSTASVAADSSSGTTAASIPFHIGSIEGSRSAVHSQTNLTNATPHALRFSPPCTVDKPGTHTCSRGCCTVMRRHVSRAGAAFLPRVSTGWSAPPGCEQSCRQKHRGLHTCSNSMVHMFGWTWLKSSRRLSGPCSATKTDMAWMKPRTNLAVFLERCSNHQGRARPAIVAEEGNHRGACSAGRTEKYMLEGGCSVGSRAHRVESRVQSS